jgi:hypothetical protein
MKQTVINYALIMKKGQRDNMRIEQNQWTENKGWEKPLEQNQQKSAQLVLIFGTTELLKQDKYISEVKSAYPNAQLCGCSTAGEIYGTTVSDNSLTTTALIFEKTNVKCADIQFDTGASSFEIATKLAEKIDKTDLAHIFVLSDGLAVNGSELVRGLISKLPPNVKITGGLAGDGVNFKQTMVLSGKTANSNKVAAIAFYGKNIKIGYGSVGGWDTFGPQRIITRSTGNILYEMDGRSALALYKEYLGEHAKGLPATGLLFPLSIKDSNNNILVRTILSVDEQQQSLTFAGDVPQGAQARLMKANFDRLIDGATEAARNALKITRPAQTELAVLISCVGRKLILKQRVEEEIEGIQELLGQNAILTGFYSYGEIAPTGINADCSLHNQTMTITTFSEK